MPAGFERDHKRRTACQLTGRLEGFDFRVSLAKCRVPTFAQDSQLIVNHHRTHGGIRFDTPHAPGRKVHSPPHRRLEGFERLGHTATPTS